MKSDEREHNETTAPERKPGRSFIDPNRPLGQDLIERTDPYGGDPEEGIYGRTYEHYRIDHGVSERARCVGVLRKAEELMASNNPSGETEQGRRRAVELACGRCGVKVEEYDRIVEHDEELKALHATVMDSARRGATKL